MSPATEVLAHVADLQSKAAAATVTIDSTLDVLRTGLLILTDTGDVEDDKYPDLLEFLRITLANRQTHLDDALRVLRAAVGEASGPAPVSASAHGPVPLPSAAPCPHYMADLVDRAATLLSVYELGAVVPFTVWAEGGEREYIARVVWQADELAPRVKVFLGRSGDFVCQSLVGNFFEVDPSTWCTDVPSDEVDREICEQAQRTAVGAAR